MTQIYGTGKDLLETYINKDGIKVIERFFSLPLDYSNPNGEKIRVFARNLIPKSKAKTSKEEEKLPYLLYLQGGPGFEVGLQGSSGFAAEVDRQHRMIVAKFPESYGYGDPRSWLSDQRGTGLSTPISAEVLITKTDEEKAEYLKHFRADNIVRDCEAIRKVLLGHKSDPEERKWTVLGQSFGGFCAVTYLSFHSEGLKEVFLTGGLPPLVDDPDEVYRRCAKMVLMRNKAYYQKYPQDVKRVRRIVQYLGENQVKLPNGGLLSPARWLQLGMDFGIHGGIDRIHQLVFRAANDLECFGQLSFKLLQTVERSQSIDGNPLYAILHESIYCQGTHSNWSAERIINSIPEFSRNIEERKVEPIMFTGEMIFATMFDEYSNLRPLKAAAHILADFKGWGALYDIAQLAKNDVKVSAAVYMKDMYVDFDFSQHTASRIKGTEVYITNQLFHNAVSTESKEVMKALFQLSKREYD